MAAISTRMALRRAAFLKLYLGGPPEVRFNATRTVLALGWARSENPAAATGARMVRDVKVREAIEAFADRAHTTAEKVITRTALRAYSDVRDVLAYDADGKVTVIPSADLTEAGAAIVAGVKARRRRTTTPDGVTTETTDLEVKLRDDDGARRDLLKLHGLLRDRVEHSGPEGGAIPIDARVVIVRIPDNQRGAPAVVLEQPTPDANGHPRLALPENGR